MTAADKFRADVGVRGGKIVAIADKLTDGAREIDATGLLVLPGGIDSHVHLAQPSRRRHRDGRRLRDRHPLGGAGGNTTVLPFALQERGQSLRACGEATITQEADGNCYSTTASTSSSPIPPPWCSARSCRRWSRTATPSFKVFMTYEDLALNDRQLLEVFDGRARDAARWSWSMRRTTTPSAS